MRLQQTSLIAPHYFAFGFLLWNLFGPQFWLIGPMFYNNKGWYLSTYGFSSSKSPAKALKMREAGKIWRLYKVLRELVKPHMESLQWHSQSRFLTKVMIRICDSGDVEGDGNDDKDDINEEDDLSQGFPVLLHPFWSTSSSQLLIPGNNSCHLITFNIFFVIWLHLIWWLHLIRFYLIKLLVITFE